MLGLLRQHALLKHVNPIREALSEQKSGQQPNVDYQVALGERNDVLLEHPADRLSQGLRQLNQQHGHLCRSTGHPSSASEQMSTLHQPKSSSKTSHRAQAATDMVVLLRHLVTVHTGPSSKSDELEDCEAGRPRQRTRAPAVPRPRHRVEPSHLRDGKQHQALRISVNKAQNEPTSSSRDRSRPTNASATSAASFCPDLLSI